MLLGAEAAELKRENGCCEEENDAWPNQTQTIYVGIVLTRDLNQQGAVFETRLRRYWALTLLRLACLAPVFLPQ
jgi:hypothetical protein